MVRIDFFQKSKLLTNRKYVQMAGQLANKNTENWTIWNKSGEGYPFWRLAPGTISRRLQVRLVTYTH